MKISVVVITRNEGAELRRTVENLQATLPPRCEVVVVDDGSRGRVAGLPRPCRVVHARSLGVARARNLGVEHSTGDMLVFADAHIRVDAEWWRPLAAILENPKAGAASPAVTHLPPIRDVGYGLTFKGPELDARWLPKKSEKPSRCRSFRGCCVAMRRETFDAVGGWDAGLLHRGGVDNELSVRMWTLGYDLYVDPRVVCRHLFRKRSPYHVGWPEYLHNRLRLALAHFSGPRIAKVVAALQEHRAFGAAMALTVENGITERRREMRERRVRTDNQYFARFGIKW